RKAIVVTLVNLFVNKKRLHFEINTCSIHIKPLPIFLWKISHTNPKLFFYFLQRMITFKIALYGRYQATRALPQPGFIAITINRKRQTIRYNDQPAHKISLVETVAFDLTKTGPKRISNII